MRWPWQKQSPRSAAAPTDWIGRELWREWEPPRNLIAGEQSRQEALTAIVGRPCDTGYCKAVVVELVREPKNEYDANAIAAHVEGRQVGYLRRELAEQLAPALDRARSKGFAVPGIIRGGRVVNAPSLGCHIWLDRPLQAGISLDLHDVGYEVAWPPRSDEVGAVSIS